MFYITNKKILASIITCFAIILAITFFQTNKMDFADDLYYSNISNNGNYLSFIWNRYFTWSSRIPIDLSTLIFINHIDTVRVINSIFILAIIIASVFYARSSEVDKIKYYDFFILSALFFAFTNSILKDSVWWVTGSFNYLWPSAFSLLGFIAYSKEIKNNLIRIVLILCTAFSIFNEQIAVFSIIVMSVLAGVKIHQKKFDRLHALQYIVVLICASIVFLAPGNSVRFIKEMGVGFNDYHTLGFLGKIYYGTTSVSSFLATKYNIVLYIAMFLAIINSLKKGKLLSTILTTVSLLVILTTSKETIHAFTGLEHWHKQLILLMAVCWSISILTINFSTNNSEVNLLNAFIFLSSILIVFALGFSPSIFYDRPRTFFFSEVVLAIFTFRETTKIFKI
ncbi:hypothetical protein U2G15_003027 [Escherichia coli]|uniref:DUF6056 family protein n=1 Tax=Escherichia fergusonii TaxID=564 RepID=UPI0015E9F947|nr:DUF6056 family protein [Escherichia fergusonii]EGO4360463.1 hypothetical protein [Escherichia coli]EMA2218662.1 hypothetical protein [Escherichia coli]MBA8266858.1 hypothetical protein [Escherichia fergusonii]MCT6468803.1 DUF6056 family protein [Escherichia coli]MCT6478460.1 DUF6056 family protein [Escherichia coli]